MKVHACVIIIFLITIFSCCKSICEKTDLGDGYTLDCFGKRYNTELMDSMNTIVVLAYIIEYAYDSDFILIAQRPWGNPSVPGWDSMTYSQHNIAFENSKFCQYWIVNKKEKEESITSVPEHGSGSSNEKELITSVPEHGSGYSNVYGPFIKEKYLQKRKELNVSDTLNLKWKE